MARYSTWQRADGSNSQWMTGYWDGPIAHKHQETIYVQYKLANPYNKKPVMDKIEFNYLAAKKFVAKPDFNHLNWWIESDNEYFMDMSNYRAWQELFGRHLINNIMSKQDKEDLVTILHDFVDMVDEEYKHARRKIRY